MKKTLAKLSFLSFVLCLAVALTGVAHALEWADGRLTLNGWLWHWSGYRFGFYGHERDSGLSIFRTSLQLEAEAKFSEDTSLYVIWRGAREPGYNLEDPAVNAGNFDTDVLDEEDFREYYLTWQMTDRLWVALGKQQVVWGDLGGMGLRVMDFINPLDLRWHFAFEAFEHIRKPLHMVNLIYSLPAQNANLQFIGVPGIEDTWERVNSIYGNPGHRYGVNNPPPGSPFSAPPGRPKDFFPGVPEDDEADADPVDNSIERELSSADLGLRWQQTVGGITYALMAAWTHHHAPVVFIDLGGVHVNYDRQFILGGSFNYYNEPTKVVMRGEIGYFPDHPYSEADPIFLYNKEEKDTIKFGFGFDRNTFFNWLSPTRSVLTQFQIIGHYIMDHDDALTYPGYLKPVEEYDVLLTLFINWGWSNDRVQINFYPAYNLSRDFGILQAWIDYQPQRFARNFTITPKLNLLYGRDPWAGDFGLTRGCSEGLLELRYEF